MTIADLVVSGLAAAGTRTLFGVPGGGGNLDLIDAARRAGLRFVLTHTETAGAIMATAQAELTGAPGACLCTLGPGVASIVNGVAHAALDRVPLVVVSDARAAGDGGPYEHQRLDHRALLGPIVKSSVSLTEEGAGQTIAAAIATALARPCGPVHVDCPPGLLARPAGPVSPAPSASPSAPPQLPDGLTRLLQGARRPIVIAGLGARGAAAAIRRLCARRGVPALVTYKAKGVIADADPAWAGLFTLGVVERPFVESSDLILAIGLDPVELLARPWPFSQPVIGASAWPLGTDHVPVRETAIGDVATTVNAIDGHLTSADGWDAGEICRERQRQRDAVDVACAGLSPAGAIQAIASGAAGCRVTVDAGAHMFPTTMLWPAREPGRLLISNGLSTMGYALPAAIGASLLAPDEPVVAITGDGGLLMCLGELVTAVRERLPIVVVVFADEELSLIRIKQAQRALPPVGVQVGAVDWCGVASALGFGVYQPADEAGLEGAVAKAIASRRPALIEARVDPGGYARVMQNIRG